jgi:hypothetical protein
MLGMWAKGSKFGVTRLVERRGRGVDDAGGDR